MKGVSVSISAVALFSSFFLQYSHALVRTLPCCPQAHFADLLERYGSPLLVLDLVKHTEKRERESIVGQDYRSAIEHVNSTMPPVRRVLYCRYMCLVSSQRNLLIRHQHVLDMTETW